MEDLASDKEGHLVPVGKKWRIRSNHLQLKIRRDLQLKVLKLFNSNKKRKR